MTGHDWDALSDRCRRCSATRVEVEDNLRPSCGPSDLTEASLSAAFEQIKLSMELAAFRLSLQPTQLLIPPHVAQWLDEGWPGWRERIAGYHAGDDLAALIFRR